MKTKLISVGLCLLLLPGAVPGVESLRNLHSHPDTPLNVTTNGFENWSEQQKLLASDGEGDELFGYSIALFDNTAIIGTPWDNDNGINSGSACVFIRVGSTWTQQAKLLPSDGAIMDQFGWSVSLSVDTALVGAVFDDDLGDSSGSVYVFFRNGSTWEQQAKLLASDGKAGDWFGYSVSLVGDIALIGAAQDNTGSVYVFQRNGATWTQQAKLPAPDGSNHLFGNAVCLGGSTALIGAAWDNENGAQAGSVYVFTRNGTEWTQQQKLLASDGEAGAQFGCSLSLDGDTALIGADGDKDNGAWSGSAYVFSRAGSAWSQQAKLLASNGTENDYFGVSVSLCEDTAVIGAIGDHNHGFRTGGVYVFSRKGMVWTQTDRLLASDGETGDSFGCSVALDGDTLMIGAYEDDSAKGSVYVFTKPPTLDLEIKGGVGIHGVILNRGTATAHGVEYEITVEGGLFGFIALRTNGTVDIPRGESRTIDTKPLFGLGPITITITASNTAEAKKGIQLIIVSIVGH